MAITHAAWRHDMEDAAGMLAALAHRLDTRIAELQSRGAGPRHLALIRERYVGLLECAQSGKAIIGAADDQHIPVGEAVISGGGAEWLANDKQFHTAE